MPKYSSFKKDQLLMETFRRFTEGKDFISEEDEAEDRPLEAPLAEADGDGDPRKGRGRVHKAGSAGKFAPGTERVFGGRDPDDVADELGSAQETVDVEENCPVPPKTVEVNGESVDTQEAAKIAEKVMGSDLLKKLLKNPEVKAALDKIAQETEQKLKTITKAEISEMRRMHEALQGPMAGLRTGRDEYPDWEAAGQRAAMAPIGDRPTHGAPKKKKKLGPIGDASAAMTAVGAMGGGCLVFMLLGGPGLAALTVALGSAMAASVVAMGVTYLAGIAVGMAADYIMYRMGSGTETELEKRRRISRW